MKNADLHPTNQASRKSSIDSSIAKLSKYGLTLLFFVTLLFGLNWPAMKIALTEVTVLWFRTSCLWFGGIALLAVSALSRKRWWLLPHEIMPIALCAFFNILCWHLLSAYGVSLMPAGRASIIAFTMPLWAVIFSAWLLKESLTLNKIVGLLLGITGLAVLTGSDLLILRESFAGPLCMLGAALGWGLGTVLFKRGSWNLTVSSNVAWQLLIAAIPMTFGALIVEPIPSLSQLSIKTWIALAYIYVLPTVFCQWAYFKAVNLLPASIAAISTLMIPVIGVYSSGILLTERVGTPELFALLLICSALTLVLVVPNCLEKRIRIGRIKW